MSGDGTGGSAWAAAAHKHEWVCVKAARPRVYSCACGAQLSAETGSRATARPDASS